MNTLNIVPKCLLTALYVYMDTLTPHTHTFTQIRWQTQAFPAVCSPDRKLIFHLSENVEAIVKRRDTDRVTARKINPCLQMLSGICLLEMCVFVCL